MVKNRKSMCTQITTLYNCGAYRTNDICECDNIATAKSDEITTEMTNAQRSQKRMRSCFSLVIKCNVVSLEPISMENKTTDCSFGLWRPDQRGTATNCCSANRGADWCSCFSGRSLWRDITCLLRGAGGWPFRCLEEDAQREEEDMTQFRCKKTRGWCWLCLWKCLWLWWWYTVMLAKLMTA